MRTLIVILSIALLSALAACFCPWWVIAVVAFLVALVIDLKPGKSFFAGFMGVVIFWLVSALWKDIPNDHILSTRMAGIFHLPNYITFLLVTAIIGGLAGGLAALSGTYVRKIF